MISVQAKARADRKAGLYAIEAPWRAILFTLQKEDSFNSINTLTSGHSTTTTVRHMRHQISDRVVPRVADMIRQFYTRTERCDAALDCVFEQIVTTVAAAEEE